MAGICRNGIPTLLSLTSKLPNTIVPPLRTRPILCVDPLMDAHVRSLRISRLCSDCDAFNVQRAGKFIYRSKFSRGGWWVSKGMSQLCKGGRNQEEPWQIR